MNTILMAKADNLISVYNELKKKYKWRANDVSLRFAAFIFALFDVPFEINKYDTVIRFIKKNTGIFSYYRSTLLYSMAAQLMCQFDNYEQSFLRMLEYDHKVKNHGFKNTTYLGIAAYALLLTCTPDALEYRIIRAQEIYKGMKEKHFWLTSSDDYAVSILLAAEDEPVAILIDRMEQHYNQLRSEGFGRSNGLQFLSHLLTFRTEQVSEKVTLCREIASFLKENKLAVSSMYYGTIGLLALLGNDSKKALEEVVAMVAYMKSRKDFKWYYKEINTLMISALVSNEYMEEKKQQQGLSTTSIGITIEALIAAQTAAMIAATTAATSAASASASAAT